MAVIPPCHIANLTWTAARDRLAAGASAVLPVGAAAKQHGGHLPLNTDAVQAEWFALKLAEQVDGLVWPTVGYGHYPAFTAYPGSVSLSSETFEAATREIVNTLLSSTTGRVFIISTGISTIPILHQVLSTSISPPRTRHIAIYRGREFLHARAEIESQPYGSHADEIETSVMLAIAPDCVDMSKAAASPSGADGKAKGPLDPGDPFAPAYAPSGSWGDPTLATVEKGRILVDAMLRDITESCARADPAVG